MKRNCDHDANVEEILQKHVELNSIVERLVGEIRDLADSSLGNERMENVNALLMKQHKAKRSS